jgi:molybdate transport system regulatory protein
VPERSLPSGLRFRIVLRSGFWLGPGKADLLQAVAETGSLVAAAARFDMSYKRGWSLVREMNAALMVPLVTTEKGGRGGGGGAQLTDLGRYVLELYRRMENDADNAVAAGVRELRHLLAPPHVPRARSTKPLPGR